MVSDVARISIFVMAFLHFTFTLLLGAALPREGGRTAFGLKFQLFLQGVKYVLRLSV